MGMNKLNTGKSIVPSPNPEKKVRIDAENETRQIKNIIKNSCISSIFDKNNTNDRFKKRYCYYSLQRNVELHASSQTW
jgi:hypothetical protein